jgi:hypothetical protein
MTDFDLSQIIERRGKALLHDIKEYTIESWRDTGPLIDECIRARSKLVQLEKELAELKKRPKPERETGHYWVKLFDAWEVAAWDNNKQRWYMPGDPEDWCDENMNEIGARVPEPAKELT